MLADKNTSNGAPCLICAVSTPEDALESCTGIPVFCVNWSAMSSIALCILDATAIVSSDSTGLLLLHANKEAMRAKRKTFRFITFLDESFRLIKILAKLPKERD